MVKKIKQVASNNNVRAVSVRFTGEEYARLATMARNKGMTVTGATKKAAVELAEAGGERPVVERVVEVVKPVVPEHLEQAAQTLTAVRALSRLIKESTGHVAKVLAEARDSLLDMDGDAMWEGGGE